MSRQTVSIRSSMLDGAVVEAGNSVPVADSRRLSTRIRLLLTASLMGSNDTTKPSVLRPIRA